MTLVTQAMIFAAQAHDGMVRKGSSIPYIVHPAEVVAIAATITDDAQVLAAAALHDVMEDCDVGFETLCEQFGPRVAQLVLSESQTQWRDPCESWTVRKQEAVSKLMRGSRDAKIIALADKLSNMRAICRDYERCGEEMFLKFHQHDKRRHAWYYRSCASLLEPELGDTQAWEELSRLIARVFNGVASRYPGEEEDTAACAG